MASEFGIGASLPRIKSRLVVRGLFNGLPDLAVEDEQPPAYRPNLQLRGVATLPGILH